MIDLSQYPRRGYVTQSTPLEHLPRLSKLLEGPEIYIKRDDYLPGAFGGNKTRRLDFVFADVLIQGADTVITAGALQSNHCRMVAAWAAREGLKCHLAIEERQPGTFDSKGSGNFFLFKLLGVQSITVFRGGRDEKQCQLIAEKVKKNGGVPYIIPGVSCLDSKGYVDCAQEILAQLKEKKLNMDHMVTPTATAGTQAGLLVGLRANGDNTPVYGVSVRYPKDVQEDRVLRLANQLTDHLRLPLINPEDVWCTADYIGPGHSLPTDEMVEAVSLLAQYEGIVLDPVYSGKAMAAMIGMIRQGKFKRDENVMFLHTGGGPALFHFSEPFEKTFKTEIHDIRCIGNEG